mgnify:CR=1 FL=1
MQRLRDGRWLVTDRSHLKVYAATVRLERVVGRTGSGPGEFRHVRAACMLADGRWQVLDRQQRRLSRFTPDGQHLETRAVASSVEYDGCFGDVSLLVRDPPEALQRTFDRGESPAGREYRTLFRRIRPGRRVLIAWSGTAATGVSLHRRTPAGMLHIRRLIWSSRRRLPSSSRRNCTPA